MTLFYMTIPLFVLAILVAVVPLVVVSRREIHDLVREAELRFDRHHREHPGHHRMTRRASPAASASDRHRAQVPASHRREKPWYEPVVLERG